MIRCNGSCSGGKAIPGKRAQAGETDPSAEHERDCFAVSSKSATRSTSTLLLNFKRSLTATSIESSQMTAQNLDVYETFRAQRVSSTRHCKISNLAIGSNGKQEPLQAARSVPYPIDPLSKTPLVLELDLASSCVFLSVSGLARSPANRGKTVSARRRELAFR
jgi:hypothetical protein